MNDFAGMEDLMQDFLIESSGLLSDIDSMLPGLLDESPDSNAFNAIFRNFHTIKGGAGFLNATELVALCHLAESLFDKLRNGELPMDADVLDVVHAVMEQIRKMFGSLAEYMQPAAAAPGLVVALNSLLKGSGAASRTRASASTSSAPATDSPDWNKLYQSVADTSSDSARSAGPPYSLREKSRPAMRASDKVVRPVSGLADKKAGSTFSFKTDPDQDGMIRVDPERLNQALNLSDEMTGIKNKLVRLLGDLSQKNADAAAQNTLHESINQIDALAKRLWKAIVRTRMQPIGGMFGKCKLLVDDLSRQFHKHAEVMLAGEETEIDTGIIDQLGEPLTHLLRNALTHGIEDPDQRIAAGKSEVGLLRLGARQEENRIIITLTDDGRGMRPETICTRAVAQGLLDADAAKKLGTEACLNLIFLPGFSARDQAYANAEHASGLSKAQAAIKNLGGTLTVASEFGSGCEFTITLPLKLALLQVRQLRLNDKLLAVPSDMVRGVLSLSQADLQQVSGQAIMMVQGEVLPVLPLSRLIGWEELKPPELGVHIQFGNSNLILAVDGDAGPDEVAFKSIDTLRPKGVTGASMSSAGKIVLILDVPELLADKLG